MKSREVAVCKLDEARVSGLKCKYWVAAAACSPYGTRVEHNLDMVDECNILAAEIGQMALGVTTETVTPIEWIALSEPQAQLIKEARK